MPSNDKLYEIFEKYNLNSQSVKSVETKKHANRRQDCWDSMRIASAMAADVCK